MAGIWMDAITIGIFFIPFYAFSLLPIPFYQTKGYQLFLKIIFHITNTTILAFNLIDVEYYKFTAKRSTADLFTLVSTGNDINQLLTTFIADFWWLILLFVLDRKSTRLNSSHVRISYAVFCLKKKKTINKIT